MDGRLWDISWLSLWRILFFGALATLMYFSLDILMGLFLAIVISSGLEFIVNYLEKKGIPRTVGVILIFLASALLVIVTIYTVVPLLIIDLNTAFLSFNKLARNSWWGQFIEVPAAQSFNQLLSTISNQFFATGPASFGAFSNLFGGFALTVSVIISSFYLSLSRDGVERFIRIVFPADYEEAALSIYEKSRRKIGLWFRTQILLSLIVGVLVLIALLILGVRHAMLLGLLAGVLEIVPFIGPIIAGSGAVISALISSPTLAFWTLIVFLVIHQIESHILIPLFIGRNVGLHPVVVIMALLIGIEVGGFMGALISVPMAVVLQEIVEHWSGRKRRDEMIPLL
jgi:predicted PurR-regulated permease PerM